MRTKSIPTPTPAQIERFWSRVDKLSDPGGCWLWVGSLKPDGYAQTKVADKANVLVHRLAYTLCVGPIPAGLTIDHVKERGCTHRHCVNPAHLEPVTFRENMRRTSRAHCSKGHKLTLDNVYVRKNGSVRCRTCAMQNRKDRDDRLRIERPARLPISHCKRGHEYTPENTQVNAQGQRWCRACNRIRSSLTHQRRKLNQ